MAPLDTTTNAVPLRAAMVSAKRSRTCVPSAARLLEPTFTITRRARAPKGPGATRGLFHDIAATRAPAPRVPRRETRPPSAPNPPHSAGHDPLIPPPPA